MSAPIAPSGPVDEDRDDLVVHRVVELPLPVRRRVGIGVLLLVVGALCIVLGLGSRAGVDVPFTLSPADAAVVVPDVVLPARATAIVLGVVVLVLGTWQLVRGFSRRGRRWAGAASGVLFLVSFLCWAGTGRAGTSIDLLSLGQETVFLAVPLALGALGGILCERSGVINVAIEGQMLSGAFAGALVATVAHSRGAGVIGAVVAGGLLGALLAVFAIRYFVNQVVLGVVLNVLALGLTGFVYDAVMQPNQDSYNNPGFFDPVKIPLLGDIPVFGPLLFDANVIVYVTYVLVVVVDIALFRTRWGLRTRAVGEHPRAAETVGIDVRRTRYVNTILGGGIAGLAGAYLTIGTIGAFSKDISSGRGFIALAAVIFGRWSPRGAIGAALLFGFADALQTVLSIVNTPVPVPSAFLAMLPYLATLFAVAGLVGRVRAPAADGQPYVTQ